MREGKPGRILYKERLFLNTGYFIRCSNLLASQCRGEFALAIEFWIISSSRHRWTIKSLTYASGEGGFHVCITGIEMRKVARRELQDGTAFQNILYIVVGIFKHAVHAGYLQNILRIPTRPQSKKVTLVSHHLPTDVMAKSMPRPTHGVV